MLLIHAVQSSYMKNTHTTHLTNKYSSQTVGINTLGTYMKRMFVDANINRNRRNIKNNHSGKVTCCTALYNAGFGDKTVMGRSGHRSNSV